MTHPDRELLQAYVATRSHDAFAAIVARYVDVVYAAARRQVGGDAHLAEDVAQAAFIVLAQRAASVPANRPLSGWLLRTVAYCAANARRADRRREHHERKAAAVTPSNPHDSGVAAAAGHDDGEWADLAPLLDEGMNRLRAADRDALLLKFFEKKTLAQIGQALGISEPAARKRVERAVERLRDFFQRRGVAVSAVGLVTLLLTNTTQAAPAALTAGATAAAAAATTAATTAHAAALAKGAMLAMAAKKAKLTALAAMLLLGGGGAGIVAFKTLASAPPPAAAKPVAPPAVTTEYRVAGPATTTTTATTAPSNALKFPDGSTVEVLGLTEVDPDAVGGSSLPPWLRAWGLVSAPADAAQWWTPDGSPLPANISPEDETGVRIGAAPNRRQIRMLYVLRGPSVGVTGVSLRVDGVQGRGETSLTIAGERVTNWFGSMPRNADRVRMRFGVSSGPWREDASFPVNPAAAANAAPAPSKPPAPAKPPARPLFDKLYDQNGRFVVEHNDSRRPRNIEGRDQRLVVILRDGKALGPDDWRGTDGRSVARFACRKADVDRLAWQTRPFHWSELPEVALRPKIAATQTSAPNAP